MPPHFFCSLLCNCKCLGENFGLQSVHMTNKCDLFWSFGGSELQNQELLWKASVIIQSGEKKNEGVVDSSVQIPEE